MVLADLPDDGLVVVDALISSTVLVPHAGRLRLVVLQHMIFGDPRTGSATERAVLTAATTVITTSQWTRQRLLELYPLDAARVHVARPGADPADLASGTGGGGELLCVGAVVAAKGQDTLLSALSDVDGPWNCTCVGAVDLEPGFVEGLRRRAAGFADRFHLVGPRSSTALDRAYSAADLLVVPSRGESYGMVITEALARGLPVIATAVGGVPEALGRTSGGRRPGLLVTPDHSPALAAALRRWLDDRDLRQSLRAAAEERRRTLSGWDSTVRSCVAALIDAQKPAVQFVGHR